MKLQVDLHTKCEVIFALIFMYLMNGGTLSVFYPMLLLLNWIVHICCMCAMFPFFQTIYIFVISKYFFFLINKEVDVMHVKCVWHLVNLHISLPCISPARFIAKWKQKLC